VHRRIEALPDWSRDGLLTASRGLAMLYVGDLRSASHVLGDAPLNTDDRPAIEFLAPRLTRVGAGGDKDWFIGAPLADFYDAVGGFPGSSNPFEGSDATREAQRAGNALFRYALAATRHDEETASRLEDEVRRLVPEVVLAGETASNTGELTDARRRLADLRSEQNAVRRQLEAMEHRLEAMTASRGAP
jgi:hypothetical protein